MARKLQAKRKYDIDKMIKMECNAKDSEVEIVEMVEVEVNPANFTVSIFPPCEEVSQLFTAEWPIAQKAAGTSQ